MSSSPTLIREGLYGASFTYNNESLFMRMELVTQQNGVGWSNFNRMSTLMSEAGGVLSTLVEKAGEDDYKDYCERNWQHIGLTQEESADFTNQAMALKKKTANKIIDLLEKNSSGSNHMWVAKDRYVVYITKNSNFSIQAAKTVSLRAFIDLYSDILISVGSQFTGDEIFKMREEMREELFENRGIFRNPWWVFKEKYAGLSILLHGFSAAVAQKYFPEKKFLFIKPRCHMFNILKKALLPGDGYEENLEGQKTDITALEYTQEWFAEPKIYIHLAAMTRIYYAKMKALSPPML